MAAESSDGDYLEELLAQLEGAQALRDDPNDFRRAVSRLWTESESLGELHPGKWVSTGKIGEISIGDSIEDVVSATEAKGVSTADVIVELLDPGPEALITALARGTGTFLMSAPLECLGMQRLRQPSPARSACGGSSSASIPRSRKFLKTPRHRTSSPCSRGSPTPSSTTPSHRPPSLLPRTTTPSSPCPLPLLGTLRQPRYMLTSFSSAAARILLAPSLTISSSVSRTAFSFPSF